MHLTPWQEADWFAFHALEGLPGEASADARAMRLAIASQCQDVDAIRSLFDREHAKNREEESVPIPLSDEERETMRRFEESLRDRRERGEKL